MLRCSPSCDRAISVASLVLTQIILSINGISETIISIFLTIVAISKWNIEEIEK